MTRSSYDKIESDELLWVVGGGADGWYELNLRTSLTSEDWTGNSPFSTNAIICCSPREAQTGEQQKDKNVQIGWKRLLVNILIQF